MDDDLVNKIINSYSAATEGKTWHDDAVTSLTQVLASLNNVDNRFINYVKLMNFIDARNTDNIFEKLKFNMESKNIRTNSDLIRYVEGRKIVLANGVRDIFGFRSTGPNGLKALYTYMKKELDYCPFKDGCTPRELNS